MGSEVGVHAQLAGVLASFFDKQGKPDNAVQLDEATKAECADVRTEVLGLAGLRSFTEL